MYVLATNVSTLQPVSVVDVAASFIALRSDRLQTGVDTKRVVARRLRYFCVMYVMALSSCLAA